MPELYIFEDVAQYSIRASATIHAMEKESSVVGRVDGDRHFAEEFFRERRERRERRRNKQSHCSCNLLILRSLLGVDVVDEAVKCDKDNFPSSFTLMAMTIEIKNVTHARDLRFSKDGFLLFYFSLLCFGIVCTIDLSFLHTFWGTITAPQLTCKRFQDASED